MTFTTRFNIQWDLLIVKQIRWVYLFMTSSVILTTDTAKGLEGAKSEQGQLFRWGDFHVLQGESISSQNLRS